jgi:hypothetical protein
VSQNVYSTSASPVSGSTNLINLWWEKHATGLVRYDPSLLVLHRAEDTCGEYEWGTLFYSKAREEYKARIGSLPEKRAATFDLDLMKQLELGLAGGLIIAANPNSIIAGHLVVYPQERCEELSLPDIRDMCRLAAEQTELTFIHNMERAAASIIDWAHFQAYPWNFPLARETPDKIFESSGFKLSRLPQSYPAYTLVVSGKNEEVLAGWLFEMLQALGVGREANGGRRIPCNIVWRGAHAWLIPRSLSQSELAATYIGALELGGLFCLPSADSMRQYLPAALRNEVRQAGIADEREMREWCEQKARDIAIRLSSK